MLFRSDPGFISIVGAVAALSGMSVYTSLNLRESREKPSLLPNHNLPLAKQKSGEEKVLVEDKPAIV